MSLALVAPLAPAALEPQHAPVLAQLDRLDHDLARPDLDIPELLGIHDRAVVLGAYCREVNTAFDLWFDASVARLRSERRVGQVLEQIIDTHPTWAATPGSKRSKAAAATAVRRRIPRRLLHTYGISGSQASRWRMIAKLPEAEFEARLEAARAARREVSTTALVRAAQHYIEPAHHGGRPRLSTRVLLRRIATYMAQIKRVESAQEHQLLRNVLDIAATWQQAIARPDVLTRRATCLLCARDRPALGAPARCPCGGKWVVC